MAPAQHLKEDSTAPMAVTSVGSEERGVRRRSSSNSCWWKMAASASLQICGGAGAEGYHHEVPSSSAAGRAMGRSHQQLTRTECIMATASTGNEPLAVSPDNITQSAPSSTALATSLPSALVGRGWDTMLSSICIHNVKENLRPNHRKISLAMPCFFLSVLQGRLEQ